jgi:hypothetical protein
MKILAYLVVAACFSPFGAALAQWNIVHEDLGSCGQLKNAFGPFDYRPDGHVPIDKYDERPHSVILKLVGNAHFTPEVESLARGKTGDVPGGDIDYTLRAFPNHHRALMAMVRLGEKENRSLTRGAKYSVECYFTRAITFRPKDSVVRMIYAQYLSKNKRLPEAVHQLELASASAQDNPFTQYNVGLVYFDLKDYEKALLQAHKAIELGLGRTELREQLQNLGKWREPSSSPGGQGAVPSANTN